MLTGCGFQTTELQKRIIRFIILYGHVNTMHDKNETKQEEKKTPPRVNLNRLQLQLLHYFSSSQVIRS